MHSKTIRALIRKGQLRYVEYLVPEGHIFRLFDGANRAVPKG